MAKPMLVSGSSREDIKKAASLIEEHERINRIRHVATISIAHSGRKPEVCSTECPRCFPEKWAPSIFKAVQEEIAMNDINGNPDDQAQYAH